MCVPYTCFVLQGNLVAQSTESLEGVIYVPAIINSKTSVPMNACFSIDPSVVYGFSGKEFRTFMINVTFFGHYISNRSQFGLELRSSCLAWYDERKLFDNWMARITQAPSTTGRFVVYDFSFLQGYLRQFGR